VEGAERLREPAERAGGGAAQHDAFAPRLAQHAVESVRAPGPEHAHDVATADIDQILREQVRGEVVLDAARPLIAAEQRDVAGVAAGREAPVEAHDVVVGIARGGRQEAHARALGSGEGEHVVVEQGVALLHREAAAAKGHDLGNAGNAGSHRSPHLGMGLGTDLTTVASPDLRSQGMDSR
jgi:hypothetical protein